MPGINKCKGRTSSKSDKVTSGNGNANYKGQGQQICQLTGLIHVSGSSKMKLCGQF